MADIQTNIGIGIDTSAALAGLRALQKEISVFQTQMAKGSAINAAAADGMRRNLVNNINASGQFQASMRTVTTTTDSFTNALERNKLSMGQYFRYAGGASRTFGRLFRTEFDTINKVARERVKDLQTQYIKMGRDANGAMKAIAVRPLVLDMKNLGTQTAIAAQKQALLNQLLRQGSTNLLNFGKNTQWAGRQLMVGFTVPMTYLGVIAGKTFMQMEEQVIRFKRVYGELFTTAGETDRMVAELQTLAKEFTRYGVAVEDTMKMAADAAAMGKMGADLTAQVQEATRLAILGGVEQEQALETTISVTNAFGVATEELASKIDFLNAVENQTVVSIEDLTIAIPKAGPVIQQLGGDVEDLAFFLTAMKEGGINASEGANALKSGLASLINPSEKSALFLKDLGININAIVEGNAGDVKNTVIGFANALDTLDPLNRARAIEQLFGKFQFSRLSTLFQNVVKEGTQASRVLKLTNATTEELAILSERELKRIEDSPMYKFKEAVELIKVELVPLGKAFLEAVTPIVKFGAEVLEKFNGLEEGTKKFIIAIAGIGGIIAPVLLMGFGLVANGVANLIKGFTVIKGVFNKASGSSTVLGQSVEYLSREQLQASAIAASLDQVHGKLTQTFTSEAAAVNNLRRAYQTAYASQTAFMGAGALQAANLRLAGAGVAPKARGFNSGVLSVPGPRGAGDIVPAMLSPGEAVIPAKQAQKYSGFISSMIADNVPGFRFGRNPFAKMKSAIQPENAKYGVGEGLLRLMTGNRLGSFGSEPNFWQDSIAKKFIRSNPKIAVRMQDKNLLDLINSKDKRYKSVFETKKSNAGDTEKDRAYAEQKLFGLPQDIDPSKRPTYGYMFKEERGQRFIGRKKSLFEMLSGKKKRSLDRSAYQNIFKNSTSSLMNEKTFRYGNAAMILKNRNIKNRTTFTYGDSYNRSLDRFGTPAKLGTRNKDRIKQSYTSKDKDFFEAQIMGGFTLKDVKRIVVTEPQLIPTLQEALRQQGLKIPVGMPKFTMLQRLRSIVSDAKLYGTTLNAQGNRINHRYQNNELPVTQKDGSYGIKREGYIRRPVVADPPPELNFAARLFQKMGVPGYNNGVLSVPGRKGAGDVVPAMLAPGEAVIPAKQSEKYQDLIKGIVSGSIPGYEDSVDDGIPVRSRRTGIRGKAVGNSNLYFDQNLSVQAGHMASGVSGLTKSQAIAHVTQEIEKTRSAMIGIGKNPDAVLAESIKKINAIPGSIVNLGTSIMEPVTKLSNVATANPDSSGMTGQGYLREMKKLPKGSFGIGILARLPENHGIPDRVLSRYANDVEKSTTTQLKQNFNTRLGELDTNRIHSVASERALSRIRDSRFAEIIRNSNIAGAAQVVPAMPGAGDSGSSRRRINSLFGDIQTKTGDLFYGRKGDTTAERLLGGPNQTFGQKRDRNFLSQSNLEMPTGMRDNFKSLMSRIGKAQYFRFAQSLINTRNQYPDPKDSSNRFKAFQGILDDPRNSPNAMLARGLDRASDAKSPSKKLVDASAKNMVDGAVKGIEDGKKDATNAGKTLGTAFVDGTKRVRVTEKGQFYSRDTGKRISAEQGNRLMALDKKNETRRFNNERVREQQAVRSAGIQKDYGITQAQYNAMSKDEQSRMKAQRRQNDNLTRNSIYAASELQRAENQKIADEKRRLAEKEEKRAARKAARAGMGGRIAGGVGGAAMVGVMGASMMGGEVGAIAQQLMLPAMMLPMILPMLTNPIGLAVVAIGALTAGMLLLNEQQKQQASESYKLTMATGASRNAIEGFAEFAGNVTANQILSRRRQEGTDVFQIREGKTAFGDSYLESEAGAALRDSMGKAIEDGGRSGVISDMTNQLSSAVISGALSPAQARSVAGSLAEQIGDREIGFEVNSRLTTLLGPNGENLLTDPLGIRMSIIDESQASSEKFGKLFAEEIDLSIANGLDQAGLVGSAAASGAIAGAAIGAWLAPFTMGMSVAVGAAIGGIVAGGAAYLGTLEQFELSAESAGAFTANVAIGLQQEQQMLDSLQLDYEKRIEIAKAAGDTVKAEELQNEYIEHRNALLEQGRVNAEAALTAYNTADDTTQNNIMTNLDTQITNMFKDDPLKAPIVEQLLRDIEKLPEEQQFTLKTNLLSGNIGVMEMQNLLSGERSEKNIDLIVKVGLATASQVDTLAGLLGDETITTGGIDVGGVRVGGTQVKAADQLYENVGGMEPGEVDAYIAKFDGVRQVLEGMPPDLKQVGLSLFVENEGLLDEFNEDIEELKGMDVITVDVLQRMWGDDVISLSANAQAYFDSLPKDQQIIYGMVFRTMHETIGTPDMIAAARGWALGEGADAFTEYNQGKSYYDGARRNPGKTDAQNAVDRTMLDIAAQNAYLESLAFNRSETSMMDPVTTYDDDSDGGGGGREEKPDNPFAGFLKQLKEIRRSTIELKETAEETLAVMNSLFDGGRKQFSGFTGISQQIRNLGGNQALIDTILGMSEEEWEKWKGTLFAFDNAGNITALRQDALNIQSALNAISLGEYQDSQKKTILQTGDQFRAVNKLIGQGFSLAQAYSLVQDSALATAIAQTDMTSADFTELKNNLIEAERLTEALEARTRAVAESLDFSEESEVSELLTAGGFTQLEVQAILSSDTLQDLIAAGDYGSVAFAERLQQILSSPEFMQSVFDKGFSMANDAFSIMEEDLTLQFEVDNSAAIDAVDQAQKDIADLQYSLDDYQAGLRTIENQERDINEKYDLRYKALDKISKQNDKIAQKQKSQISIAEAIARGDIASAATAIQEFRAQQAQQALEDKRASLELSQENELASLTAMVNGQKLTRLEIEEKVRETEQAIFDIEELRLEPNQRALELANRVLEQQIENLTVLGQTRDQWAEINNNINLARINTEDYVRAINAALLVLPGLQQDYADDYLPITAPNPSVPERDPDTPLTGPVVQPAPAPPVVTPPPAPAPTERPLDLAAMSLAVYRGNYGNGQDRINRLMAEGYTREQVRQIQAEVNRRWYSASGGLVPTGYAMGGMVASYLAAGGGLRGMPSLGTDTVPAMLTPGEFVVRKYAVQKFGEDRLKAINSGTYSGDSVYNYSVNVSVSTDANPDKIAGAVLSRIKQIDSQRIKGNRY
jgi:TP901 family phage tail tape measure protein